MGLVTGFYEDLSAYGFDALLLSIGIVVLANGFAYALASALKLNYGRLIAGLTILFIALILVPFQYTGIKEIIYVGAIETLMGLFDILACKVGSPLWALFDPNKAICG